MMGAFVQRQEHDFDLRWEVPDMDTINSVIEGEQVVWQTKQIRIDRDQALFGEVSFDVNDFLTLIGGHPLLRVRELAVRFQRGTGPLRG